MPPEVLKASNKKFLMFGKEYIIPSPFDPRLIHVVSPAVAKAAVQEGIAQRPIKDWKEYE